MYICRDCGKIYEDEEIETIDELPYGEVHCGLGAPIWDNNRVILKDECDCGGEITKAKKCEKCNEWTTEDRSFCLDCLDTHKNLETMLEIGADWEEKISLNGFLMSAFTKEDIEQILIDILKNTDKETLDKHIDKYCEEDIEYFWGVADKKCRTEK